MMTFSRVLVIIGLMLGVLGGLSGVLTLVFGDALLQTVKNNESMFQGNASYYTDAVKQATARTMANILLVSGRLLLVLVGGTLGLLAAAADTSTRSKTVFSAVVVASGIGLIAMHSWVCAAAYTVGGIVALLASLRAPDAPRTA